MCVPLRDQYGKVRYFLGAQLDITGLVLDCTELDSLKQLIAKQSKKPEGDDSIPAVPESHQQDAFEQLSETFNPLEFDTLFASRQRQHPNTEQKRDPVARYSKERVQTFSLKNSSANLSSIFQLNGQGSAPPLGFYQNVSLGCKFPLPDN